MSLAARLWQRKILWCLIIIRIYAAIGVRTCSWIMHFSQICTRLIRDVSSGEGHYCFKSFRRNLEWAFCTLLFSYATPQEYLKQNFQIRNVWRIKSIRYSKGCTKGFTLCFVFISAHAAKFQSILHCFVLMWNVFKPDFHFCVYFQSTCWCAYSSVTYLPDRRDEPLCLFWLYMQLCTLSVIKMQNGAN